MIKTFFPIFFCICILFANQVISAESLLENSQIGSLSTRKLDWPNWNLPGPFKYSQLKQDLIYPSFLEGDWRVISIDVNHPEDDAINYLVRFQYDSEGNLIGDRAFNTESIGKKIFGEQLLYVRNDFTSANRQIAMFTNSEYLETKIIGRNQEFYRNGNFFTDELALQIFHSSSTARINQVETLSQYQYCKDLGIKFETMNSDTICAEQWQVMYKEPGDNLFSKPLKFAHFKLIFILPQDQIPPESFLTDLSTQKDFVFQDDL